MIIKDGLNILREADQFMKQLLERLKHKMGKKTQIWDVQCPWT